MGKTYSSPKVTDWLKPRKPEAMMRLRINGLGLIAAFITTQLLPLPSPWNAFQVISGKADSGGFWWAICALELLVFAILGGNLLQASYALQYPPAPHPPLLASTPRKPVPQTPVGSSRRLRGLTPTSTPQPQKAFSSSYAASPLSTPSRTLNYSVPPSAGSVFDSSFNSTTSSLPGSPSPIMSSPLAAYRGKHSASVGRAFDGDLMSRLTRRDSDDE